MAARIITRTSKRDHIKPVLKQLHWMPVKQRIEYKVLIHTFKVLSGQSPSYLIETIQPYHPARTLGSQDKALLIVPKSKTRSYGDRHFSVSSAKLWNVLPNYIKNSNSVQYFKRQLKTYLFTQAFAAL